jgi:hypothetical protein
MREFYAHCNNLVQCSQEKFPAFGVETLAILLIEDSLNEFM